MSEENEFEALREEIDNLQKRVDHQETYIVVLAVFVLIVVILNVIMNSSGFFLIGLVVVLALLITIPCKMLEKKGI